MLQGLGLLVISPEDCQSDAAFMLEYTVENDTPIVTNDTFRDFKLFQAKASGAYVTADALNRRAIPFMFFSAASLCRIHVRPSLSTS
jgi:hypothetical protein